MTDNICTFFLNKNKKHQLKPVKNQGHVPKASITSYHSHDLENIARVS